MKRWTFRIVLCLLLGVITTVGVAWLLGLYSLHLTTGPPSHGVVRYGGREIVLSVYGNAGIKEAQPYFGDVAENGNDLPAIPWAERLMEDAEPVPNGYPPMPTARGFPCLAMGCVIRSYWNEKEIWTVEASRGILLEPTDQWAYRVIPFTPILPGFIINTLFYAVIWFGPFFGIGAVRRSVRKQRGRCQECGYDLRGAEHKVCPECGEDTNRDRA